MFGRMIAVVGLAGLIVGCNDVPTAVAPAGANLGVSEPGTAVNATFQITAPAQTITTYLTTPKNDKGYCLPGGQWFNQAGNNQGFNHTQCTDVVVTGGSNVTVTFSVVANYVSAKSGNINLNFSQCGYTETEVAPDVFEWVQTPCTAPTFAHYKKNSNWTEGTGVLYGKGDDGSAWTISLGQIGHAGNAQMLARAFTGLLSSDGNGGLGATTITW